jgi:hypothetical protein
MEDRMIVIAVANAGLLPRLVIIPFKDWIGLFAVRLLVKT